MATARQRFDGIDRLYGHGSVARLGAAHVCVVGLGGVGSWAAEALARSGVGTLTLIDADDVCVSNANRQSQALVSTVGRSKVAVLSERMRAINPAVQVHAVESFVTPQNLEELFGGGYDAVLDSCDAFRVKVEMIAFCRRRKLPIVVSGSAGGRTDPTRIQVRDLARVEHDVLLAQVRRKLRDEFGYTRNPKRDFGVPAVYSSQHPRYPHPDGSVSARRPEERAGSARLDCGGGLGAAMHVTASFGMAAVARTIERLLRNPAAR